MGFINSLKDWRRRQKAINAYMGSRKHRASLQDALETPKDEAVEFPTARAVPKLSSKSARRSRIIAWRTFRPILRWQRRTSKPIVFAVYFGVPLFISVLVSASFLASISSNSAPVAKAPNTTFPGTVNMQLGINAKKAFQQQRNTPDLEQLQPLADQAFRTQNYAEAEKYFRQILPYTRYRAFTGFQIFICLLMQGKEAEAEVLLAKFPSSPSAKNPSGIYARAALDIKRGHPESSVASMESARRLFPLVAPLYDQALRDAGILTP